MNKHVLILAMLIAACTAGTTSTSAVGASFHCGKANSAAEQIICNDAELSSLDDRLGKTYRQAKLKTADRREFTARSEGFWRWREKNCLTRACLIDWYQQRQIALDAELTGAPMPATTLASLTVAASPAKERVPENLATPALTVTPGQLQAALAQVQALVRPAPPSPIAPLQPHYVRNSGGEYVYEDMTATTLLDGRPQVTARYLGLVQGEHTLIVQRKAARIRYTCDKDCTYIRQLTLPGYGLHDLDIVKNDHVSLAPIIMRDAMNGLLAVSSE